MPRTRHSCDYAASGVAASRAGYRSIAPPPTLCSATPGSATAIRWLPIPIHSSCSTTVAPPQHEVSSMPSRYCVLRCNGTLAVTTLARDYMICGTHSSVIGCRIGMPADWMLTAAFLPCRRTLGTPRSQTHTGTKQLLSLGAFSGYQRSAYAANLSFSNQASYC